MDAKPYISVIVPVYNAENRIEKCIRSLMAQDYEKDRYEIILVDNNSRDRSADIIKSFPVKYLLEKNTQTSYAARNAGIRAAKGDVLAFTDDDCIAFPDWLSKAAGSFSDPGAGCVAGEIEAADPENWVEEYLAERKTLAQKATVDHPFLPYPQTANAFYRKEVFEQVGCFEEKWVSAGDADLAWRMQLDTKYKLVYLPESRVVHKHRSSVRSMYGQRKKWGIGRSTLYKKYRRYLPKRRVKETWWDIQLLAKLFIKYIQCAFSPTKDALSRKQFIKTKLDFISFLGSKLGELAGSFKNGVYYV